MEHTNIEEMKAEVLLHHLYPELSELWIAENKGTFYRNYSKDIMQLDEEMHTVTLSRNGFLRLLPQGLITTDDDLKGGNFKQKYEQLKKRQEELEELFRPIDSLAFRKSLKVEAQISQLLEDKLDFLLEKYFHCDRKAESNVYVRELMPLLPYVSRLRTDFRWIRDVLAILLGHRVTLHISRYDWSEWKRDAQPLVQYRVWVPALDNEEYHALERQLPALRDFISEWFIPFDTRCLIELKDEQPGVLNKGLTLNYNTRLTNP